MKSGSNDRGNSFVLLCLFGTVYSIYSCCWVGRSPDTREIVLYTFLQDFIMDWSILEPRSRYPLLRPELVYTNVIPVCNQCPMVILVHTHATPALLYRSSQCI
jgi:hypothetical protein